MNDLTIEAKIVFLGDTGVGKTSIVLRFVEHTFSSNSCPTIGASFLSKTITVGGTRVKLQLWDTAGQERFRSLAPMYYRGATVAILVFDVTNEDSFARIKEWVKELRTNVFEDILLVIVGNQIDKKNHYITEVEAREYAHSIGATFHEASAKMNIGIEDIFLGVTKYLIEEHHTKNEFDENFEQTTITKTKSNLINQKTENEAGCCAS